MPRNQYPPPENGTSPTELEKMQERSKGAAGLLMVSILLSRLLGFVRDRIIAHQFGQGFDTDVYNAAFSIPDLFFFLIAGGAISSAFIPVFTDYFSQNKEREAWRIFSVILVSMTILMTLLTILGFIFTPQLVALMNPGYIPNMPHSFGASLGWIVEHTLHGPLPVSQKAAQTIVLSRILLPAQICFMIGSVVIGTHNARGYFLGQAWGPIIYNFGIIFGGLVLSRYMGIAGLCWGGLIGAIAGNVVLQLFLLLKYEGRFFPQAVLKHRKHAGVKQVVRLMLPVVFGLSLPYVSTIIGRGFASDMGNGPQSAYMNANRLMQLPLGIFAQSIAMSIFPLMSALAAQGKTAELQQTVCKGVRQILFLTVPSSALMIVLALPFVQLLLQSGKFTAEDSQQTAQVLIWFCVGIFAWSAHSVLTRGFYALQETWKPVAVGTFVTILFIPLNIWLKPRMGVSGLALATSIAATVHMTSMLVLLRQRLKGLDDIVLVASCLKILLATSVTTLFCKITLEIMNTLLTYLPIHSVFLQKLLVLGVCGFVSAVTYTLFALKFRMEEFKPYRARIRKLVNRFA